jgi:hypothetical protein
MKNYDFRWVYVGREGGPQLNKFTIFLYMYLQ